MGEEGINFDNEGWNCNQSEVDRVNVSQTKVEVEVEGSEDSDLNVNFEDSENDI